MIQGLSAGFVKQSVELVRCVPAGGGSIAMLATIASGLGSARLTGLKPGCRYLLAGAAHPCAHSDAAGEAIVTIGPYSAGFVTLVPVI